MFEMQKKKNLEYNRYHLILLSYWKFATYRLHEKNFTKKSTYIFQIHQTKVENVGSWFSKLNEFSEWLLKKTKSFNQLDCYQSLNMSVMDLISFYFLLVDFLKLQNEH